MLYLPSNWCAIQYIIKIFCQVILIAFSLVKQHDTSTEMSEELTHIKAVLKEHWENHILKVIQCIINYKPIPFSLIMTTSVLPDQSP